MNSLWCEGTNSFIGVSSVTSADFYILVTHDAAFCDYFNKFCFLPIFGQKIAYSKRCGTFVYCPNMNSKKRKCISNDIIRDWLFENRFASFSKSKVADEYKLCTLLKASAVLRRMAEHELDTHGEYVAKSVRDVTLSFLAGVSKMAKFREFIASSRYARHLVSFWMDAEHLRRIAHSLNYANRQTCQALLRAIQKKYYRSTSKFFLTTHILRYQFSVGTGSEIRRCNFAFTMLLQEMVFEILRDYWVPRFLLHALKEEFIPNEIPDDVQSIVTSNCDFEDEEDMIEYALRRSCMVRWQIGPNSSVIPPEEGEYDEDENNVLLQDQVKDKKDIGSGKSSRTTIGRSDVDFIHRHFFNDENSGTSHAYKTTENEAEALADKSSKYEPKVDFLYVEKEANEQPEFRNRGNILVDPVPQSTLSCRYEADNSSEDGSLPKVGGTSRTLDKDEHKEDQSTDISHECETEQQTTVSPPSMAQDTPSATPVSSSFFSSLPEEPPSNMQWYSHMFEGEEISTFDNDAQAELAEILLSDELSGFVFRSHLAMLASLDELLESSGRKNITKLISILDFWRDVESYKRSYLFMESHELATLHEFILRKYFSTDLLNEFADVTDMRKIWQYGFKKASPGDSSVFNARLTELQSSLQKVLEKRWLSFAAGDRMKFNITLVTEIKSNRQISPEPFMQRPMMWRFSKRRNSFPSVSDDLRRAPIVRKELKDIIDIPAFRPHPTSQLNKRDAFLDFIGYSRTERTRYRSSRAVYLLLMCVRSAPCPDEMICWISNYDYERYSQPEIDSDSDGSMTEMPKRTFVRLPDIDGKMLSRMSVREYPTPEHDYTKFRKIRVIRRHRLIKTPMYLRPIVRGGVSFERPRKKPKSLLEVLRDPLHSVFFKRFMRMHNSEAPLLFWKSVDLLKRTDNIKARQKKAKGILKKFFGRLAGGGILLQCNDELIREMGNADQVTTSMLAEAQALVYKSMEKNWGQRYLRTFTEESKEEEVRPPPPPAMMKLRETRLWKVFGDFIRTAANFIKMMRRPRVFRDFKKYLKHLTKEDGGAGGDAKVTTAILTDGDSESERKITTCRVLGREITLEYVYDDLLLWTEVDRYLVLCENAHHLMEIGCYEKCDEELLHSKAKTIVTCFFDSLVPPRLRVNVGSGAAEKIVRDLEAGKISRGLFHEAILATFPLLIHFWRRFCSKKYPYKSRKDRREERRIETRKRREKLARLRKEKLGQTLSGRKVATCEAETDFVEYFDRPGTPFQRVKGIVSGDHPTLHFSLQYGLKLILPPKHRAGDTSDGDGAFLQAWTRGAKAVNVLGVGSDPKLFETKSKCQVFDITCDLIG